ncbi:MAG: CoA transferase [Chloroflexi bacterium]|nr:CoA transferase [Chloroflexota bacterium]
MTSPTPSALAGLRILDFTRVLAGPSCTMLLADFGAEVIKIEHPQRGDDTREWGPPWFGAGEEHLSAYYLSVNRNKRSVTLNLKTPEGIALAKQLALKCDVLIENFKVGQMASYGLGYEQLQLEHPSLIYCSITGYGQTGPYAARPGYDYVIQAQSGLMAITGPADGPPYKVGVAIADVIAGLYAANAIQAALHHRHHTGQGQHIDIALLDTQFAALVNVASNFLVSGQNPPRYGNGHPNIVPYQAFEAADKPFIVAVGNDAQFAALCKIIGQPELAKDGRFATNPARVKNREVLVGFLQIIFGQRPAEDWTQALLDAGIPSGPINQVADALADPHVQSRQLVQTVMFENGEQLDMVGPPVKLSATPPTIRHAPPLLGQDTEAVLADWLGLEPQMLARYRQQGII